MTRPSLRTPLTAIRGYGEALVDGTTTSLPKARVDTVGELADLLGIRVAVESDPGRGAWFDLVFDA